MKIKRIIQHAPVLFFLVFMAWAVPCSAKGRIGLGAVFGGPTGASTKFWTSSSISVDGIVGFDFTDSNYVTLCVDLVKHWIDETNLPSGRLSVGVGGGPALTLGPNPRFGIRIKGLIDYVFQNAPIGIFAEIAPALMIPDPELTVMGGIGLRFYF
jgi:hypothetical protein